MTDNHNWYKTCCTSILHFVHITSTEIAISHLTTGPKYFAWIILHHIHLYIITMAVAHPGWLTAHPKIWKIKFLGHHWRRGFQDYVTAENVENVVLLHNRVFWPQLWESLELCHIWHKRTTCYPVRHQRQKQGSRMKVWFALAWAMFLWVYHLFGITN